MSSDFAVLEIRFWLDKQVLCRSNASATARLAITAPLCAPNHRCGSLWCHPWMDTRTCVFTRSSHSAGSQPIERAIQADDGHFDSVTALPVDPARARFPITIIYEPSARISVRYVGAWYVSGLTPDECIDVTNPSGITSTVTSPS